MEQIITNYITVNRVSYSLANGSNSLLADTHNLREVYRWVIVKRRIRIKMSQIGILLLDNIF